MWDYYKSKKLSGDKEEQNGRWRHESRKQRVGETGEWRRGNGDGGMETGEWRWGNGDGAREEERERKGDWDRREEKREESKSD